VSQTVVEREQSDLIDNIIYSCTDCCWKGAWTTLSAAAQTVVGREQSNLMDNTIYSCTDRCWKGNRSERLQEIPQLIIIYEI